MSTNDEDFIVKFKTSREIRNPKDPIATVIMANFNGERYLGDAIKSVLKQSIDNIELIFIDDASADSSLTVATKIALHDNRLQVILQSSNEGPAAARNRGLEIARGHWIAIMDSDDLMKPDRLRSLIETAERDGADIVADNLLVFDDPGINAPKKFIRTALRPSWIDIATYVRSNALFKRKPSLGYLKPIFRATTLRREVARYNENLRIGEDYDLVVHLLARGARFRFYPEAGYFYRRHSASTSHRLTQQSIGALITAHEAFFKTLNHKNIPQNLTDALEYRARNLHCALNFDKLIMSLKQKNWRTALKLLVSDPSIMLLLRFPILARLSRYFR